MLKVCGIPLVSTPSRLLRLLLGFLSLLRCLHDFPLPLQELVYGTGVMLSRLRLLFVGSLVLNALLDETFDVFWRPVLLWGMHLVATMSLIVEMASVFDFVHILPWQVHMQGNYENAP